MLAIKLFGRASIERDGNAVTGPSTQRHRMALLAMLAAAHPRSQSRERLVAHLWPERPAASSRNLMNQGVHALRKELGQGAVVSAGNELRFELGSVSCDVIDFKSALEEGECERAVNLYSGPFLEGFALPDAIEFEQWVDQERERLRRACCEALEALAVSAEGDAVEAVRWWRRLAALEPHSASVALGLMRTLEASGNRAAALAHAEVHAQLLEEEFDAEPNPDVRALAERLRTAPVTRLRPRSGAAGSASRGGPGPLEAHPKPVVDESRKGGPRSAVASRGTEAGGSRRRLTIRRFGPAGVAALCLSALVMALWPRGDSPLDPRRVLVVSFENRTGEAVHEDLGFVAADWITENLRRYAIVRVVPTETAVRVARYVGETAETNPRLDPLRLMAEETGAGTVVSGVYYQIGDSLRFQARITDARRSELLSVEPAAAPLGDPEIAIEQLRHRVVAALASILDPRLETESRMDRRPPSLAAFRAYREGVEHFISGHLPEASQAYERAAVEGSMYMAPRISLAFTLYNLGRQAEADSLVGELLRLRDEMGVYDQAIVELLESWTRPDRTARYEAAKRVAELAPGSLPHVQWAAEALWLNRPREALEVLSGIDPTRGVVRGYAPYWLVLTSAHHVLGDHRRELEAARRARSLYPADARLIWPEARALAARGRLEELERVVGLYPSYPVVQDAPRPRTQEGMILGYVADDLAAHGHRAAANDFYGRSLAWYQARVAERPEYRHMVGVLLAITGQNEESHALYRLLVEEEPGNTRHRGMVGVTAARGGNREEAERVLAWLAEQPLSRPFFARPWYQALIAAQLGDSGQATGWLKEAFELGRRHGFDPHVHPFLDPLRGYPPFEELLRPKG